MIQITTVELMGGANGDWVVLEKCQHDAGIKQSGLDNPHPDLDS